MCLPWWSSIPFWKPETAKALTQHLLSEHCGPGCKLTEKCAVGKIFALSGLECLRKLDKSSSVGG